MTLKVGSEMTKVMVVAVHPDDETLGCGGTLLKHKSHDYEIHWLILTNISQADGWPQGQVNSRQEEIDKVANAYDFSSVHKLDFPTTKLDNIPMSDLIYEISAVIKKVQPNVIYLNNRSDIHTDHQIAFKAVMSSVKSFRHPYIRCILMYETLSETEFSAPLPGNVFQPNVFVDVSAYFEKKCKIMRFYDEEILDNPYPRSLESLEFLARYRGSRIGVTYAEAFMLIFVAWTT